MGKTFDGSIGPDQRLVELAAILAAGISRLHLATARAEAATTGTSSPESRLPSPISPELALLPLERSRATGVTVTTAVNSGEGGVLEPCLAVSEQEYSTWL